MYIQTLTVPFTYPVAFTRSVFDVGNPTLIEVLSHSGGGPHRVLAVLDAGLVEAWPALVDEVVAYVDAHADHIALAGLPLVVDAGEACKNDLFAPLRLQRALYERGIDRHAFVLIVGGGALLDMAGYAAATAHRGVRVLRVPSTVLAQADSGVGVKCGINAFGVKNFVGAFAPPAGVVVDGAFLATLERRDRVSGMAEAVKVALVRDRDFFAWIEDHVSALGAGEPAAVDRLIRRSAELHLQHIARSGDPFETGSQRPLDFGHWSAHKLETLSEHRLRHGEAVAIGVALDAHHSVSAGLLAPHAFERIVRVLEGLGLSLWDPAAALRREGRPLLLDGIEEFRLHLGGALTVTLLADVGRGVETHTLSPAHVAAGLAWLAARANRARAAVG